MPSVADMYRDILPANGADGGLTARVVRTVPIDLETGNPTSIYSQMNANDIIGGGAPAPVLAPKPTTIDATNPIDIYRLGLSPQRPVTPAVQAINAAAPSSLAAMYGSSFTGGWGSDGYVLPSMNQTETNGMPIDQSRPLNLSGITGGGSRSQLASAPAPVVPKTPIQTLADMFTPAKPAKVGYNGSKVLRSGDLAGNRTSLFGENAVLPPSMNNERWNTGY